MKVLRGSFFYVADNCALAWELCQKSGEEPSTPYADKGTRGHAVLAGRLPPEELTHAETRDVEKLYAKYQAQLADWLAGDQVTRSLIETEFVYRAKLKPIYSGHPDQVIFAGERRAFIPDFKFSWQPLNGMTATNRQLMAYVPLVKQRYPELESITTSIIALSNRKNPPALFKAHDIKAAEIWALSVAKRAYDPGEKHPDPGPWCQYCSGKILCPVWEGQIAELAAKEADEPDAITDEALSQIAPKLSSAKKVIDRLQARLEQRVREAPEKFPEWTFKPGRVIRKIVNPLKAWKLVRDRISPDEFIQGCDPSIVSLEEAFHKHFPGTRKESDAELERLLAAAIDKRRAKSSLVYDPKPPDYVEAEEVEVSEEPLSLPDRAALPQLANGVPEPAKTASQAADGPFG
jgi:Protein of unknown function (DUF2800)